VPPDLSHLLAICLSCQRLHPDGYACSCLIARAQVVAETLHDLRRAAVPRWRRPRPWAALPELVRQEFTLAGLALVDALEGAGWRLVTDRAQGTHAVRPAAGGDVQAVADAFDVPLELVQPARFEPDPDAVTPPSGGFRVPNVIRS